MKPDDLRFVAVKPEQFQEWIKPVQFFLSDFLQTCPQSHKKNYQVENWKSEESSFLKCILIDKRYESGILTLALRQNQIVALSACHLYQNNLACLGSRSCALPGYEKYHLISTSLIPMQQAFFWNQCDYGFVSFNTDEYSIRVMNSMRGRKKWSTAHSQRVSKLAFSPFHFIQERTFNIHGCEQFVAYCTLRENPQSKIENLFEAEKLVR